MTWIAALAHKAVAAAAALTGKKLALMVASSLVATTGIVAAALTSGSDLGPLAALVGRSLASQEAPASTEPAEPAEAAEPASRAAPPTSGGGAGPAPLPAPAPSESPTAPEEKGPQPAPEEPAVEPGQIQHVFVVNLASSGYEGSFGPAPQMPYLAETLRPQGLLLSSYSLLDDSALANSIAAISGQPPNAMTKEDCPTFADFPTAVVGSNGLVSGDGCIYPVEALSLADQITGARIRWHAYMEAMTDEAGAPDSCVHPQPGAAEAPAPGVYSSRLNPFVYFHSLVDLGDCSMNDVPLSELDKDLRKVETTPNYSYISPTPCNAGVAGQCPPGAVEGPAAADAFLASVAGKILKSPAYAKDGLLVVTFNQVSPPLPPTDPAAPVPAPNPEPLKVGTLLISRFVSPGSTDAVSYDPYSLLKSVEDIFRLDHLGRAQAGKVRSLAPALLGENGGD